MFVFLCPPDDISARWFVAELRRLHGATAHIITPQELVYATDMQHRLDETTITSSVALKSHATLDNSSITGLINRVQFLPDAHLATVNTTDRTYMQQELLAIWSSWISALPCPVINRPTATSMAGPTYHPAIWYHNAAAVGLPVPDMIYDSTLPDPLTPDPVQSAIVCQGRCYSASVPTHFFDKCCDLAAYVGLDLVELYFSSAQDGLVFSYASPIPYLGHAHTGLIAQVAQMIKENRT